MLPRSELLSYLNEMLAPDQFQDYAPNGLQVEGRPDIGCIVTGVTASLRLIDHAVALHADAILVHHGYFWRGEAAVLTGMKFRRIKRLIEHDINLIAYHLPLDDHVELGNNAQLGQRLGLVPQGRLDPADKRVVGQVGETSEPIAAEVMAARIEQALGRTPLLVSGGNHPIRRVAWCTGGAQGYIEKAVAQGVDAYISGEISEQTAHVARECGIHYFAAGHHATERYGVKALGEHLASRFDIEHHFVDIDNPA